MRRVRSQRRGGGSTAEELDVRRHGQGEIEKKYMNLHIKLLTAGPLL